MERRTLLINPVRYETSSNVYYVYRFLFDRLDYIISIAPTNNKEYYFGYDNIKIAKTSEKMTFHDPIPNYACICKSFFVVSEYPQSFTIEYGAIKNKPLIYNVKFTLFNILELEHITLLNETNNEYTVSNGICRNLLGNPPFIE